MAVVDNTVLCTSPTLGKVTVGTYKSWNQRKDGGWSLKPIFIRDRLRERYVNPVEKLRPQAKNGFMIIALSCLLIETLESFYLGWGSTKDKSKRAFLSFFARQPRFRSIQEADKADSFYSDVRCGVLHQGETKNGWTVVRSGPMFDGLSRINATIFHRELSRALDDYCRDLESPAPGNRVRARFNRKMRAVLENCK